MIIVSVTAPSPENPPCWDVIFPNVVGLRKSTTDDGALKNGYLNGAVKSARSIPLMRSVMGMLFDNANWCQSMPGPFTMFRPTCPGVNEGGMAKALMSAHGKAHATINRHGPFRSHCSLISSYVFPGAIFGRCAPGRYTFVTLPGSRPFCVNVMGAPVSALWIADNSQLPTNLFTTLLLLPRNRLPRPNGRSQMAYVIQRCATS